MKASSLWIAWEQTALAEGGRLAVVEAGTDCSCSRAQLLTHAREVAEAVPNSFVPGHVVAFAERNGLPWLAMFLGLQKRGAVALALDASLPKAQQPPVASALGAHWLAKFAGPSPVDWHWEKLTHDAPTCDGDFCLIKTTSGSTGQPKPLIFTSAQMLADGRQIAATMGIGPEDINLGAIPLGHSYGLGNLVLPLIAQGTSIVCSAEILPEALAVQIEQSGATVWPSVPVVLRALARSSVNPARLRTLRRVISAGAPLPPEVARAFRKKFGLPIQNFYGSSETGGICFDRTGEASATGHSIGTPLDDVEVRLDDENRVTVRSAAVVGAGEFVLADLGAWNAAGELVLVGRATPLANLGGKKIAPAEIERALRELEGVTDAWVGVRERPSGGGEFLLAAVETARSREDVQNALASRLPAWQVPRQWWVTPHLPRTARGKLDRIELEARCLSVPENESN